MDIVYLLGSIQGLINKRDSFCASYCLHIIYLTKVLGRDFKNIVF